LQYHSIGCYTVVHKIKRQMRLAEHSLISAEIAVDKFPNDAEANAIQHINDAWKKTLFNQFHDIYAGTSLAVAYDDARDQLGSAKDTADVMINDTIFRRLSRLPDDQFQRIYVFNPSDKDFNGYVQHDPWLNWGAFDGYLLDEKGNKVLCQRVQHESVTRDKQRIIWKAEIPARGEKIYKLFTGSEKPVIESDLKYDENSISNSFWRIICAENGSHLIQIQKMSDDSLLFKSKRMEIISQYDHSDTWSHSIKSFNERVAGKFRVKRVVIEETGPIQASIRIDAKYKESSLSLWARLYSNDPRLELKIWVNWNQHLQVLKLNLPFISNIIGRFDGIPGGFVNRPQNGQEFPIIDWTLVEMEGKKSIGIVCPDCFGLDGIGNTLRFTLLRSPAYAWHDPRKLDDKDFYLWTDQGEHEFRFILIDNAKPELLQNLAISEHRSPICYDWTKGMK
ncbi:MAG: glycoside hydrolase family 38 C-terminal domain-containing protein, partial [Candidatus Poribacteria bacterium]